jgi:HEAT repeat protein
MNTNNVILALACAVIMTAIGSVTSEAAPPPESSPEATLEENFEKFLGYDGDPVIQSFRERGQDAVAFLARKAESKDLSSRVKAVKALRQMGPPFMGSETGVAALCAALNQPDNQLRSIAAGALGDLGPQARAAVPMLIKAISAGTNVNGVWALGRIGPEAKAALPVLESKMRQQTGRERVCAAGAVWKISGSNAEARKVIEAALEDPDRQIRIMATNVVRSLELRLR